MHIYNLILASGLSSANVVHKTQSEAILLYVGIIAQKVLPNSNQIFTPNKLFQL